MKQYLVINKSSNGNLVKTLNTRSQAIGYWELCQQQRKSARRIRLDMKTSQLECASTNTMYVLPDLTFDFRVRSSIKDASRSDMKKGFIFTRETTTAWFDLAETTTSGYVVQSSRKNWNMLISQIGNEVRDLRPGHSRWRLNRLGELSANALMEEKWLCWVMRLMTKPCRSFHNERQKWRCVSI